MIYFSLVAGMQQNK